MSLYVATYDVSLTARRRHVANILRGYGQRVQRSVFEVWLDPADLIELRRAVGAVLAASDDFDLFPVDERGTRSRVSWQRPAADWSPVILA